MKTGQHLIKNSLAPRIAQKTRTLFSFYLLTTHSFQITTRYRYNSHLPQCIFATTGHFTTEPNFCSHPWFDNKKTTLVVVMATLSTMVGATSTVEAECGRIVLVLLVTQKCIAFRSSTSVELVLSSGTTLKPTEMNEYKASLQNFLPPFTNYLYSSTVFPCYKHSLIICNRAISIPSLLLIDLTLDYGLFMNKCCSPA